ncbi:protein-tyrosine phosphatase-like protein, partial [Blyttiomyces helicus]
PLAKIFSPVTYKNMKFLILDCPTDSTLPTYLEELKARNVTDVVRLCEPTYSRERLEEEGIKVHDTPFTDGGVPPAKVLAEFLALCDERFGGIGVGGKEEEEKKSKTIAIHCVAGLGRAPVLVGVALIEAGMEPLDAVSFIRQRRRGAFNSVQLSYLVDTYKRQWKKSSS